MEGANHHQDDDGDDDEVFALKGLEDEDEEMVEEDEVMEEEQDNRSRSKKAQKSKKKKQPVQSSDEEELQSEEETWGHGKSAYYASNADELESDDEEGNELEEQEAKRLQLKTREEMRDVDFGLDDALEIENADENEYAPPDSCHVEHFIDDLLSLVNSWNLPRLWNPFPWIKIPSFAISRRTLQKH